MTTIINSVKLAEKRAMLMARRVSNTLTHVTPTGCDRANSIYSLCCPSLYILELRVASTSHNLRALLLISYCFIYLSSKWKWNNAGWGICLNGNIYCLRRPSGRKKDSDISKQKWRIFTFSPPHPSQKKGNLERFASHPINCNLNFSPPVSEKQQLFSKRISLDGY